MSDPIIFQTGSFSNWTKVRLFGLVAIDGLKSVVTAPTSIQSIVHVNQLPDYNPEGIEYYLPLKVTQRGPHPPLKVTRGGP